MSIRKQYLKTLSIAALMLSIGTASAEDSSPGYNNRGDNAPSGAAMAGDLILARPLGLAATVLGSVVFVVGLPFELLAGNVSDPARRLVTEPARYTFTRPLGEDIN